MWGVGQVGAPGVNMVPDEASVFVVKVQNLVYQASGGGPSDMELKKGKGTKQAICALILQHLCMVGPVTRCPLLA